MTQTPDPAAAATPDTLEATAEAVRELVERRFEPGEERGAAAMLLDDGTIVTSTAPDALNASVEVCHETGAYCEAFTRGRSIVASICLHRDATGEYLVLSPCGVCMERLAVYGGQVRVGVPEADDRTQVEWVKLAEAHPHYWMRAFPDELQGW